MIRVEEKQIIKGQEPVSGVILTPDELAEVEAAHDDKCRQLEEAEAASKEADERLEALRNEKSEKEANLAVMQEKLEDLEDTISYLNNLLDKEERLNQALMKVKEGAR